MGLPSMAITPSLGWMPALSAGPPALGVITCHRYLSVASLSLHDNEQAHGSANHSDLLYMFCVKKNHKSNWPHVLTTSSLSAPVLESKPTSSPTPVREPAVPRFRAA